MEALAGQKLSLAGYGGASLSLKTATSANLLRQSKANHELKSHHDQGYEGRVHCVGIEPLA